MASDKSSNGTHERHLDARALRFAVIFPILLAIALVVGGVLIGPRLQGSAVLPLGGNPLPLPTFLTVGAASVLVLGAGVGSLGARTTLSRTLRRVLLGVAMTLQLSVFTLFVAALLGQGAGGGLPVQQVDGFVLLMGCGLAAAMGVVLAMTFKPDEQWGSADDAALAKILDAATNPAAAADTLAYFLHPRSSVIVMILLAAILPGALLALISPWILAAAVLVALLVIAVLCATVRVDRRQLTVKLLGIVPVLEVPCEVVDGAVSLDIAAKDYGGWGPRRHSGSATYLTYSGAAVVLRQSDGGKAVVSAPSLDVADELSAILNRRAGKLPQQR
jgi:ABC-type multidrug transport system fused ATPase/permease subunit